MQFSFALDNVNYCFICMVFHTELSTLRHVLTRTKIPRALSRDLFRAIFETVSRDVEAMHKTPSIFRVSYLHTKISIVCVSLLAKSQKPSFCSDPHVDQGFLALQYCTNPIERSS